MSTATTTHRLPGFPVLAAIACAVVVGGAAAFGVVLSNMHGSAEPVAPTTECAGALCGVEHPILPGRHDFQQPYQGHFHYSMSGGKVMLGQ